MRRLFSTFAHGAPGAGLLLMRLATGGTLLVHGAAAMRHGFDLACGPLDVLGALTGALLSLGLWTPIVAALAAVHATVHAFVTPADAGRYLLLATMCVALLLLGPGAWSIDARLFGWRRVVIPARQDGSDEQAPHA